MPHITRVGEEIAHYFSWAHCQCHLANCPLVDILFPFECGSARWHFTNLIIIHFTKSYTFLIIHYQSSTETNTEISSKYSHKFFSHTTLHICSYNKALVNLNSPVSSCFLINWSVTYIITLDPHTRTRRLWKEKLFSLQKFLSCWFFLIFPLKWEISDPERLLVEHPLSSPGQRAALNTVATAGAGEREWHRALALLPYVTRLTPYLLSLSTTSPDRECGETGSLTATSVRQDRELSSRWWFSNVLWSSGICC